jgi:tetraacyldisaccharide 4'-kinase
MRSPPFWNRERPSPLARLLQPVGMLYGAGAGRRLSGEGRDARVPVVCIGNFTAGGAGKTPVAAALARLLTERGHAPAIVSRGYKGALSGSTPVRVDPAVHDAGQVGDEPLLLAAAAPTFICADRVAGAAAAKASGADVVLLDDGMQNTSIRKQATIAVVDGPVGVGNGLCIPAGPLRAPLARQWPLVSAVVVIGDAPPGERVAAEAASRGIPVFHAELAPDRDTVTRLREQRLLAFAGIGRPEKFFATLKAAGAGPVVTAVYPDHHLYKRKEIEHLIGVAEEENLTLVTTEKDAVRLTAKSKALLEARGFSVLTVRIGWREPDALADFLEKVLRA